MISPEFRSSLSQEDKTVGVSNNIYYNASKEVADLGSKMTPSNKVLDTDVNQKILMLVDVVTGYMDMMERHDKGLVKEHKIATEKIGMIKCRDLRGALATDIEMKNLLENNINQHEIVLTDLESRQVSYLHNSSYKSDFRINHLCQSINHRLDKLYFISIHLSL